MKAYLDSSILVRLLFGEPDPLREWKKLRVGYASDLLRVEVGRCLDRARLTGVVDDVELGDLHRDAMRIYETLHFLPVASPILDRAGQSMPTVVGTLDAIHLASALEIVRLQGSAVPFATHDVQLGRAARASAFEVIGC
jgi:predicted nucleic acid-binding protein